LAVAPAGQPITRDGPDILGPSLLTEAEVQGWFASTGGSVNATVPLATLVSDYMEAGAATGVRADIAFAQSIVETGHFSFPAGGQLTGKDNNFAGIGACDHCKHGWKFPSALAGVMAQEQLLEAYATPPSVASVSSLASPGIEGCCRTWMGLSGVWASNPAYGYEILSVYEQMLAWAIPRQLSANGLLSPTEYAEEALAQASVGASTLTEAAGTATTVQQQWAAEATLGTAAAVAGSGAWWVAGLPAFMAGLVAPQATGQAVGSAAQALSGAKG
jgi:hypothetical protein